ncbi:MAG: hypothetical protein OXH76_24735, partial [Boseongicola sp.]|nr:hypothetical protein [Boseongicola sp.]
LSALANPPSRTMPENLQGTLSGQAAYMAPTGTAQEKNRNREAHVARRTCHPNPDAARAVFGDARVATHSRRRRRATWN